MNVKNVDGDEITKELKDEPRTGGAEFIMGNLSDVLMFTTGPGGICPGISFQLDNGDRYNFTFATSKPIIELHAALGAHMLANTQRLGALFEILHAHEDVGCKITHEVFEESIERSGGAEVDSHIKPKANSHTH